MKVLKAAGVLLLAALLAAGAIPKPEEVLGFVPGEDFKLASWAQIEAYFKALDRASPRLRLFYLGKTTLGRPFFMAVISSEENLARLDEIKRIAKTLHEGRRMAPEELERLVRKGKPVVAITCSIHSTEVASTLMATVLAYRLLTDPSSSKILDNLVLLLFPSLNPDGIDIVREWYYSVLNTPYEASYPVKLYHHYAGHDNNRDWFMGNLKETRLVLPIYYREFFPLLIYDVHQMGKLGVRFFFPPYRDPINPNIDPLLLREVNLIGAYVARRLTSLGKKGVVSGALFDSWYMSANRACPLRHNVISILSEAASANLASPVFLSPSQLKFWRDVRGNFPQAAMLEPWEGGWWRLRDIIEYELIAATTILELVASRPDYYLQNFHRLALRQREKGLKEPPFAYVLPRKQQDPAALQHLLEVLLLQGVEVHQALQDFQAGGMKFSKGDFVVPLSQPYRAFIKDLLEVKRFPEIKRDSSYLYPYDEAAWSLGLQMGVRVVEIREKFDFKGRKIEKARVGRSSGRGGWFRLPVRSPYSFKIVNAALDRGREVFYLKGGRDWFVFRKDKKLLRQAVELGLCPELFEARPVRVRRVRRLRIAVYQPYRPVHSEGWTRYVLDKFGFPYRVVHNDFIRAGDLRSRVDVIIIPDIPEKLLVEGRRDVPPVYQGGIGEDGSLALEEFVLRGGRLLLYGRAGLWAIPRFNLKVKNVRKNKKSFSSPGSLLVVDVSRASSLARGYGRKAVVFYQQNPLYEVKEGTAVLRLPSYYPVLSGIAFNYEKGKGKALLVEVRRGEGKVILYGFKVVNRAQSVATFPFLFNALLDF